MRLAGLVVAGSLLAGFAAGAIVQLLSWLVPVPVAVALGVTATVPAMAVRRWPLPVWAVTASALTVSTFLGYGQGALRWPWPAASCAVMLLTLAGLGFACQTRWGVAAGATTALVVVVPATVTVGLPVGVVGLAVVFVALAVTFGQALRARSLARGAAQREAEQRVVWQERARIAREMHDVVAHRLSLITVQAEAATVEFPDLDEPARARFETLRSTAARREVRSVLGVLRDDAAAPREPVPGLAAVPALLDEHRRAGVDVRTPTDHPDAVTAETVGRLPAAVELAAYRTLQEALSNAARHGAPDAPVDVELTCGGRELVLRVRNRLAPAPREDPAGVGFGLRGMRERVEAAGGVLSAGPDSSAGFAITARFPHQQSQGRGS